MTWHRQVDSWGAHWVSPCVVGSKEQALRFAFYTVDVHADASLGSVRCGLRLFSTSMAILTSPDLDVERYTCCYQHSACHGLATDCHPWIHTISFSVWLISLSMFSVFTHVVAQINTHFLWLHSRCHKPSLLKQHTLCHSFCGLEVEGQLDSSGG